MCEMVDEAVTYIGWWHVQKKGEENVYYATIRCQMTGEWHAMNEGWFTGDKNVEISMGFYPKEDGGAQFKPKLTVVCYSIVKMNCHQNIFFARA